MSRAGLAPASLFGGGSLSRCVCFFHHRDIEMDKAGREPASPTPYGAAGGAGVMTSSAARKPPTRLRRFHRLPPWLLGLRQGRPAIDKSPAAVSQPERRLPFV